MSTVIDLKEITVSRLRLVLPTLSESQLREGHEKIRKTFAIYGHIMDDQEWNKWFKLKNLFWNELEYRRVRRQVRIDKNVSNIESHQISKGYLEKAGSENPFKIDKKKRWA